MPLQIATIIMTSANTPGADRSLSELRLFDLVSKLEQAAPGLADVGKVIKAEWSLVNVEKTSELHYCALCWKNQSRRYATSQKNQQQLTYKIGIKTLDAKADI